MTREPLHEPSVPASVYDTAYYLADCDGFSDYLNGGIAPRILSALRPVCLVAGQRALDIGCGRGEVTCWAAAQGARTWGVDYSWPALEIARRPRAAAPEANQPGFSAANARLLPFAAQAFDYIFMLDIVEHLYPAELDQALREAYRVLRPGGQLIVHTAPNLWYYWFGYPILRLVERLRGRQLPRDPRARFRYHSQVHVNEQSPRSLQRALRRAGFGARVWVEGSRARWQEMGRASRTIGRFAISMPLIKWLVAGDIFAIGYKA